MCALFVCVYVYVVVKLHVCVKKCLLQSFSVLILLKTGLSLNLELNKLSRQAGYQDPGVFLALPPQFWDYRCVLPCQDLKV